MQLNLDRDIAQAGTIAIWNQDEDLFVELDLYFAAYWCCIIIMGDKEECQVLGVDASIVKGGEKTFEIGEILSLAC